MQKSRITYKETLTGNTLTEEPNNIHGACFKSMYATDLSLLQRKGAAGTEMDSKHTSGKDVVQIDSRVFFFQCVMSKT